jgi:hypothetical protein
MLLWEAPTELAIEETDVGDVGEQTCVVEVTCEVWWWAVLLSNCCFSIRRLLADGLWHPYLR